MVVSRIELAEYARRIIGVGDDARMAIDPRRRNLLGAIALSLADRLRDSAQEAVGLGGEAPAALAVITQAPGISVEQLRLAIRRSHPATVRIVDRLVERGLVERRPAARGPALALTATAAGGDRARELIHARARILDDLLTGLDDPALDAILDQLLARLAELPQGTAVCRLCDKGRCRGTGRCPVSARLEEQGVTLGPFQPLDP
jgi:MarR family transcriptional repressor of emrRAB